MRKMTLLMALFVAITAITARAQRPTEIKYLIYVAGENAGHNTMKIKQSSGVLVIDTETDVEFLDFTLKFKSHTEVDATTFAPMFFTWEGKKAGQEWSGSVTSDGSKMTGEVMIDGNVFPSSKELEGEMFFFENYVTAHQMLVMEAVDREDQPTRRVTLFMPTDYLVAKGAVSLATEIEWQETRKPVYAKRYVWQLENSEPFHAVYDPDRKIPVYMDYPSTRTEVFLASDYPEKPKVKYQLTEEEREAIKNN